MEVAAGVHELREVVSGRGGSQVQENENAPVHAGSYPRSALLAQGLTQRTYPLWFCILQY